METGNQPQPQNITIRHDSGGCFLGGFAVLAVVIVLAFTALCCVGLLFV